MVAPKYNGIQQGHGGCLSCGYKKSGQASRKPVEEIRRQLSAKGLELLEMPEKSGGKVSVRCDLCESTQKIRLDAIAKRENLGCSKCARSSSASKQVSEAVAVSEMLKVGLKPLEPYTGHKTPWLNECLTCGKEVRISRNAVLGRSKGFKGCLPCAKISQNRATVENNKHEVLNRFKELELKLLTEYLGTKKSVQVECIRCGFQFETTGGSLLNQKYGCGRCAGNLLDPDEAVAFMIEHGYEPLEPYTSTKTPWKCKHLACGRVMKIPLSTTKRTGGGCKFCANYGFQYSKPAYLYLIRNDSLNAVKIGIANPSRRSDGDRLKRFIKLDWEVIAVWNFQKGKHAEQAEKQIFKIIRKDRKIPAYLSSSQMVIGGHTETMDADSVDVLELKQLINKIIRDVQEAETK
jgi:hypothetical protein